MPYKSLFLRKNTCKSKNYLHAFTTFVLASNVGLEIGTKQNKIFTIIQDIIQLFCELGGKMKNETHSLQKSLNRTNSKVSRQFWENSGKIPDKIPPKTVSKMSF